MVSACSVPLGRWWGQGARKILPLFFVSWDLPRSLFPSVAPSLKLVALLLPLPPLRAGRGRYTVTQGHELVCVTHPGRLVCDQLHCALGTAGALASLLQSPALHQRLGSYWPVCGWAPGWAPHTDPTRLHPTPSASGSGFLALPPSPGPSVGFLQVR